MSIWRLCKTLLLNALILLILIEVVSLAYLSTGGISVGKYDKYPTYLNFSFKDQALPVDSSVLHPRVVDSSLPWGIWHLPNVQSRQHTPCFDITMKYNRFGMRGPEPDADLAENVIFLGDSFTEGFGLSEDSTIPAQFGKLTGIPTINMGVSRSGSTQQSLIYRHFADSFSHQNVVVLLFLENDFIDNNISKHDTKFTLSFKPYRADSQHLDSIVYRGHPDSSTLSSKYFNTHIDEYNRILMKMGLGSYFNMDNLSFSGKLAGLTYTRRMIEVIKNRIASKEQNEILPPGLDYRPQDLAILSYDMNQVMEIADRQGARVTFVNLLGQRLLHRTSTHPDDRIKYLKLEEQLSRIANKGQHRFISFFQEIETSPDLNSLFFTCDAHYNEAGARKAATFLARHFK